MYETRRKKPLVVKGLKCHMFLLLIISEGQSELPESKYLRVENKVFYFDAGSNRRGVYLRVSEVCMKLVFQMYLQGVKQGVVNIKHYKLQLKCLKVHYNHVQYKTNWLKLVLLNIKLPSHVINTALN